MTTDKAHFLSRRRALAALGAAALLKSLPAWAEPAPGQHRIGFFYFGSKESAMESGRYEAFTRGMREQGYVEGKNYVVEARYANGRKDLLAPLAAELVALNPAVIVVTSTPANAAARNATSTIPLVVTLSADPVGEGWATTLARPGKNMTGVSIQTGDSISKIFELMTIVVPQLTRVAALVNSANNAAHGPQLKVLQTAAAQAGVEVLPVEGGSVEAIEQAFPAMVRWRAQALINLGDSFFVQERKRIADLAIKNKLPSTYTSREYAEGGGLLTFGQDIREGFVRAANYVDRILKGAKPGDLPIEQPVKFELVINLKTAAAIGLAIPNQILWRANHVIR